MTIFRVFNSKYGSVQVHSCSYTCTSIVSEFVTKTLVFDYTHTYTFHFLNEECNNFGARGKSSPKEKLLGPREWGEKLAGILFWSFRLLLSLPPWIVLLQVVSQELVLEASFSQAHASLSHWMLCCSFDALLALILCEVLFLLKKGNSPLQGKRGWAGGKHQEKRFENGRGIFGTEQAGTLCGIFGCCKS